VGREQKTERKKRRVSRQQERRDDQDVEGMDRMLVKEAKEEWDWGIGMMERQEEKRKERKKER